MFTSYIYVFKVIVPNDCHFSYSSNKFKICHEGLLHPRLMKNSYNIKCSFEIVTENKITYYY